ncbi:helix-turn-helix domain-containing protein [Streptococcus sp. zg-JUN1979]|uniref:helix-turn-helix domain-containing protein n=1 Tax=Streptococcus sp. zg-JUN1979 TaxID=3391450 RepID=UPI0039A631AA
MERLRRVKQLLIYSHLSLDDISHITGFSSQSHMGKHFKHHYGMTPKSYRDTYTLDNAPIT